MERVHSLQDNLVKYLNTSYNTRAKDCFSPIRTLFTDDCIAREKGYFQGGARYTFAIPSDSGIPNTIDSLLAIKTLVFDQHLYTADDFLGALREQNAKFISDLRDCPCYGVGNEEADALMHRFTDSFYAYYETKSMDIGLGLFPTSHQFVRHVPEGALVGPTPDGRGNGQALSDSIAAVNGKATLGPTAMLLSASRYAQDRIYGIPVLNLSIQKSLPPAALRALVEGYFRMGGTQMQITCVSRETMIDAKKNPDAHRDLLVRVGGYSAYFCNLNPGLQDALIERTIF